MKAATVKEIIEVMEIIRNEHGEKVLMCWGYNVCFDGQVVLLKSQRSDYFPFYPSDSEKKVFSAKFSEINKYNSLINF